MSTPALYNIKTVTGLQDCLVLQIIDSLGNVISGDGYSVRGAILLKNSSYELEATTDALGNHLLTWDNLPAGVWRFDVFVNDEPLLCGNAIVRGRITPCVQEVPQDLGQFLQVQKDSDGVVKITLSDVNSAKWYAEVAKGSADEAKDVLQEAENLSLDIERQIEAGKNEISETITSATSSITSAENIAVANVDTAKEDALDEISQEVIRAQNYATSSANSATASATSAIDAQASATMAQQAQSETEALASELEGKFSRAVFADPSGNVDISGGLTVAGVASLNGGANTPMCDAVSGDSVMNMASVFGLSILRDICETANFIQMVNNRAGNLVFTNKEYRATSVWGGSNSYHGISEIVYTPLVSSPIVYGGSNGVYLPFYSYMPTTAEMWFKLSFSNLFNSAVESVQSDFTLNSKEAFVYSPKAGTAISSCFFDITFSHYGSSEASAKTGEVRTRILKRNTDYESGYEVSEYLATTPVFGINNNKIRGIYILWRDKQTLGDVFLIHNKGFYKIAEIPYIDFYEQACFRRVFLSAPRFENFSSSFVFGEQKSYNNMPAFTSTDVSPWLSMANAISQNKITSTTVREFVPYVVEATEA